MGKQLAKLGGAIFGGSAIVIVAFAQWRYGEVDWRPVLVWSLFVTTIVTGRAFFIIRSRRRHAAARAIRHRQMLELEAAIGELKHSMARLSPADLSIYLSLTRRSDDDATPCVVTTKGSPNHLVLVQMTDLKLAAPEEFRTVGESPNALTCVRYAVTPFGRHYLLKILPEVLEVRAERQVGGPGPERS
ncbi:MAG: hypothetical protein ACK4K7_01360 [Allosphingosinicella sp.]|uniref:hypothetical protein n=1 Tax=Allosphingosinicella sp. TaxID=2823234 RepID=UPI00394F4E83